MIAIFSNFTILNYSYFIEAYSSQYTWNHIIPVA